MGWKALLDNFIRPMKETAEREVKDAVDRLIRTPRPEDIASPLREELKDLMGAKHDVGYADHCACCNGQRVIDTQVVDAVESKEDPTPYLEGIYGGIIALNERIPVLNKNIEDFQRQVDPGSRLKWAIMGAVGGGVGTLVGRGVLDLLAWLIPKILGLG